MTVTIYHNPDCETSRNTLAMIRASGVEPEIVLYLETGWTGDYLLLLLAEMNLRPRDLLRTTKSPAADLGLLEPDVSDETILEAMIAHPILVNRPIVVTNTKIALCRPSERVFDLLDNPPSVFTKEDGEVIRR